jgi:UDPglucose 6-dehydrogenase
MKQRMACPVLIDLRNIYTNAEVDQHGFAYVGVGRPTSVKATRL